jgi:hypothetical protein
LPLSSGYNLHPKDGALAPQGEKERDTNCVGTKQKELPQKLKAKKATVLAHCTSPSKQTDLIYLRFI